MIANTFSNAIEENDAAKGCPYFLCCVETKFWNIIFCERIRFFLMRPSWLNWVKVKLVEGIPGIQCGECHLCLGGVVMPAWGLHHHHHQRMLVALRVLMPALRVLMPLEPRPHQQPCLSNVIKDNQDALLPVVLLSQDQDRTHCPAIHTFFILVTI